MEHREMSHALGEEIEPSPQFSARVMAAVRREAMLPPPLPFPWRRVAIGAAIGIGTSAVLSASPEVTSCTRDTIEGIARASDAFDPIFLGAAAGAMLLTFGTLLLTLWLARRA